MKLLQHLGFLQEVCEGSATIRLNVVLTQMQHLKVHSVVDDMNCAFATQVVLTDLQLGETLILCQSHTDCLSTLWTDIAVINVQAFKCFVAHEELRN